LAERLRGEGIDSRIDKFYAKSLHGFVPPDPLPDRDSWEAWQEVQIRDADYVLVPCSREFIDAPENSGAWRDVNFMKRNLEFHGGSLRKFIPYGFGTYEDNSRFVPSFIRGATYYNLTPGMNTDFGFEDLVRRFRTEFLPEVDTAAQLSTSEELKGSGERPRPVQSNPGLQSKIQFAVFISYSHDSDAHRERVLGLSERLRADGIHTILDRYVKKSSPPEGWPRWMMNGLNSATHVLCICTETYRRRFLGQEVPGKGKGANWEGALLTQALYDVLNSNNKFIPVVFSHFDESHIPEPLRSQTRYLLDSDASYQALYDALLDQAGVEPGAVGELKGEPRATAQPLDFVSASRSPPSEDIQFATKIEMPAFWDDLVVPQHIYEELRQITGEMINQSRLAEEWRVHRPTDRIGTKLLFHGQPGTGKTLAARVLAYELEADLYRLNYARVLSEQVAKTVSNLQELLHAALGRSMIIFIDDVEILFGRESNIDIGMLDWCGNIIFATSKIHEVNPKLLDIVAHSIEFPFPDEIMREYIWLRSMPKELPIIDFVAGRG
jgi:hypothetical protein